MAMNGISRAVRRTGNALSSATLSIAGESGGAYMASPIAIPATRRSANREM
jgi:hypothetical protein